MSEDRDSVSFAAALISFLLVVGLIAVMTFLGYADGYKSGQTDAAKGKWYWRLKDEGGGEKVFREFPEPKTQPVE